MNTTITIEATIAEYLGITKETLSRLKSAK
jgi:hypothetical protein